MTVETLGLGMFASQCKACLFMIKTFDLPCALCVAGVAAAAAKARAKVGTMVFSMATQTLSLLQALPMIDTK